MKARVLRLAVLAGALIASAVCAFAHPLPGSTLTIAHQTASVQVTLTIPLPELIVARPSLKELGGVAKNTNLPAQPQLDLAAYLRQHMTVSPASQSPLELQLVTALVQDAQHEDAGHFGLLVVQMSAPLQPNASLFPATLTYDAVMHEVRNHRATVWFAPPKLAPILLGKLRFDQALGRTRPLELPDVR
jgi:hypothetical protein